MPEMTRTGLGLELGEETQSTTLDSSQLLPRFCTGGSQSSSPGKASPRPGFRQKGGEQRAVLFLICLQFQIIHQSNVILSDSVFWSPLLISFLKYPSSRSGGGGSSHLIGIRLQKMLLVQEIIIYVPKCITLVCLFILGLRNTKEKNRSYQFLRLAVAAFIRLISKNVQY